MSDALLAHARALAGTPLAELFAQDASRAARLALEWSDWRIDVSKERLTPDALDALVAHAESAGVRAWIEAQMNGERVNLSEERPALHTALRQRADTPVYAGGENVIPHVRATQSRMREFASRLRAGEWRGSGAPIRHVVNLGIGGSDLGPRFVTDALDEGSPSPIRVDFVSNVDPDALQRVLASADAATTLFIVT